jgi:DNA adenine methylase
MLAKKYKTPLRYMGGKSRATKTLLTFLPDVMIGKYVEPFVGGGSMAFAFSRQFPHVPIHINDKYYNLYCFWITLRDRPSDLVNRLLSVKSEAHDAVGHRKLFDDCKDYLTKIDCGQPWNNTFEIGWRWWVCNKCSFSGLGESSGFSEQASVSNFSESNIRALLEYGAHIKDWKITNYDYSDCLIDDPGTFIYLDPPYAKVGKDGNSFLYGRNGDMHKHFDHTEFHTQVSFCQAPMMISYDNNKLLKEMYSDWEQHTFDLTYTLHSGKNYREDEKNRKELVLRNYVLS